MLNTERLFHARGEGLSTNVEVVALLTLPLVGKMQLMTVKCE